MNKTQKGISTKIKNSKNLNLIINSDTYKLAYEDIGLIKRSEMRGVRMLLKITKPDLILEENKILSTIIIFGGANIAEEKKIPIILFGREYWDKIINFEYLADLGLISDEHLNLFEYADTASEAWEIIKSSNISDLDRYPKTN